MNRFRVLQFNMQFGQGWRDKDPDHAPVDLEATVAEIRRHEADIILLQEVEHAQKGGGQIQPPPNYAYLERHLAGYHGYFAYPKADPRELPFGIGLAIFSRAPLTGRMRLDLPSPQITFQFRGKPTSPTDRLLIAAHTQVAGRDVQIVNLHLLAFFMLGASSEQYLGQREIVSRLMHEAKGAAIFGGDFNTGNHASLTEQFAAAGFVTVQDSRHTWRRQPLVLDHLFHNAALRCVGHQVCPTLTSDHHALVADFEFAG
ncbi:MAG: endonuclease/exonuclease/phosphatase family protein [Opitutales bacterium]